VVKNTYDPRTERLGQIVTTRGYGAEVIQNKTYSYTAIGEISSISDYVNNVTYSYVYDKLSRLTNEIANGGGTVSVSYNAIGNITSKTMNGNTFNYYYEDGNHKHAVSRIAYNGQSYYYSYDLNGNMTYGPDFTNPGSIQTRTIYYNADNMPTQINHSNGGITSYSYDGMGTRVKKSLGAINTYYIGDHFEVKGGETIKYIFAGNLRVAQVKGGVRSFFHKDHLGSSTVMTNANGAKIESTEYMPFGSQRSHWGANTSDYRFTDQELDAENGLYNYNARMYDPMIGRFISADTIVPEPFNPQSLNRYTYVLNNPLIYTDPSGYEPCDEYTCPEAVAGDGIWIVPPEEDINNCRRNSDLNLIEINLYDINPSSNWDPWKGRISGDALYLWLRGLNSGQDPLLTGLLMGNIAAEWMALHYGAGVDTYPSSGNSGGVERSTSIWQNIVGGKYVGTGFGEESAQYYADKFNNSNTWYEKAGNGLGGLLASLWTPETYKKTALTLTVAYSVAGWAARTGPTVGWRGGEITLTRQGAKSPDFRLNPFGDWGSSNPYARRPHYHRRPGIGKHRPWEGGW
jgi:RHS repeat-associated protein